MIIRKTIWKDLIGSVKSGLKSLAYGIDNPIVQAPCILLAVLMPRLAESATWPTCSGGPLARKLC